MTVTNEYGIEINYDIAILLMNDDIRERLHDDLAPCTDQEFFNEYANAHLKRYGEPWILNTKNPTY